jgi:hypothetical protein
MGTIIVNEILERCQDALHDSASGTRWGLPSLLRILNKAQRAIVVKKPQANITEASKILVAGVRQSLPAGAIQLIDIPYNMGKTGTARGRSISKIPKRVLDLSNPAWTTDAADTDAQVFHYVYDLATPAMFYVWPQQPTSAFGYVQLVYSSVPATVKLSAAIGIGDEYDAAIEAYILWQAFGKDAATSQGQAQRSEYHHNAFLAEIGMKLDAEKALEQEAVVQ